MASTRCTVCFSTKRNLKDVSDVDGQGVTYFSKLQYIAPEVEWKNDMKMCGTCMTDLKVACKFREQCLNVIDKLKDDEVANYLSSLVATQAEGFEDYNFNSDNVKYEIESDGEQFERQYFMCYHCGKKFTKESSIKKHLEVCDGDSKVKMLHQCEKCQKLYGSAKILQAHQKTCVVTTMKEETDYECPECFMFFETSKGFENHVKRGCKSKKEGNGTSCFCKRCDDIFDSVADLKEHLSNEHDVVDYKCEVCDMEFKTDDDYAAHKAAGHTKVTKRSLTCQECSTNFSFLKDLIAHCIDAHSLDEKSIKPYSCRLCEKKFRFASSLRNHKLYHEGKRAHVCGTCGKAFITRRDLLRHEIIHYDKKNHRCDKCGKSFKARQNLNTHTLIVHTDQMLWKFVCKVCGKRFPLKGNYDQHVVRHTGEKNFVCHLCEKPFASKKEMQAHIVCHTDVRAYKCDQCGKQYRKKYDLDVHRKRDHDLGNTKVPVRKRNFACHICPSRFHGRSKLERHLCMHTGLRPFPCYACDKKFTSNTYLKEHLKNVHKIYDESTSSKMNFVNFKIEVEDDEEEDDEFN